MTILTINKETFEKEIGKLDDKMQDRIAMFGTPIEEITNDELQIEIFPNRPDLLAYQNYKNEFLAFLGKKTGLRKIETKKPKKDYIVNIDSSVSNVRPYTACAIVEKLKLNKEKIKEIIEIQEKIHLTLGRKRKKAAIGIYPLEKIKLPITFKALPPEKIKFQPLEFPREINARQILSQHPTGREYGDLLKGLDKYPVFIDANNEVLSMPPIINSHKTGKITEETKDVFIECSGSDLNTLKKILNIIVVALKEMGGEIFQMKVNYSKPIITPNLEPEKMQIKIENVNKLLGLELKETEIKKLLEKMSHEYSKGTVKIPAYRTDILHEVDLIEDIAIAYGYENFIPEIPDISTIGKADKKEIIKSKIAEILTGLNLLETSSYHLTTKDAQIKKPGFKGEEIIEVENSKTEYSILRKDLSHYLLKILGENVDVDYPQEIFQIGTVFEGYNEKDNLAIAITPGNFTKLKQIFEYLGKMINQEFKTKIPEKTPPYFIEGRTMEILVGEDTIGHLGEVHPRVLKNFKIKMPVALMEINIDKILD